MLYCEKCRTLVADSCPLHASKHLREPRGNDPVLIAQLSGISAAMLEGLLLDEKLPFQQEGRLGAGMSVWIGRMMETFSFYVPYDLRDKALELYALVCEAPPEEDVSKSDGESDKIE